LLLAFLTVSLAAVVFFVVDGFFWGCLSSGVLEGMFRFEAPMVV
jgi:hypothetical protein